MSIIYGTILNDVLIGSVDADYIYGDDGDDLIKGNYGDDYLYGDAGNDNIRGNDGNDWVYGGSGADNISGGDGDDHLYGYDTYGYAVADGDNVIDGGKGNDWIVGAGGNDTLNGGSGNDTIQGGTGTNNLYGGSGDDFFTINGNDNIYGEGGNDYIYVYAYDTELKINVDLGNGDDFFVQSTNVQSEVTGGAGSDTFEFFLLSGGNPGTCDITDFNVAEDDIILTSTYLPEYTFTTVGDDLIMNIYTTTAPVASNITVTLEGLGAIDPATLDISYL